MRFLISFAVLTVLACQPRDTPPGDTGTQVRDSAGIRIIENAPPPDGSRLPWRISAEPAVTIGRIEGDEPYLLDTADDALRLADGRIVVLLYGTRELRVFGVDGMELPRFRGHFPFGPTKEVCHGGKREGAVSARVQGANGRAREGRA